MSNDSDSGLTELLSDDVLPPSQLASQTTKTSSDGFKNPGKVHVRKRRTTIIGERVNGIEVSESTQVEVDLAEPPTPKRKRQRKEKEKDMPLAQRISSLLRIGAHVSAAKGVQNAITNAVHIGYISSYCSRLIAGEIHLESF